MFLLRDDISEIAQIVLNGGIICYPTDTVWALGCDATNEDAVERLIRLKNGNPSGYVVLTPSMDMLKKYVVKIHPRLETLLSFHTRPLTIVYDRSTGIAPALKAPNGSVAIRVTQDPFCIELMEKTGKPMVGTVASKTGAPWPPTYGAISSEILGSADYVVKYRQDDKEPQEPSSIANLDRHQELEFLRD